MAAKSKKAKRSAAPTVHVTLALFDSREPIYRVRRESVPIGRFARLGFDDYDPAALTPLRDATAQFIGHLDRLKARDRVTIGLLLDESGSMQPNREAVIAGVNEFVDGLRDVNNVDPDSADKVLAVIVTDGLENSSREVDSATLANMISERERTAWTFIYLGANQDAWAVGEQTGFSGSASGQAVHYQATPSGTRAALASVGDDAQQYLRGVTAYATARAPSARRSITEEGEEVLDNLGAHGTTGTGIRSRPGGEARYGDIDDALRKAREATRR